MIVLVFIGFTILTFLAVIEYQRILFNKRFKNIPGIKEYPIVGNLFMALNKIPNDFEEALRIIFKYPVTKLNFVGFTAFTTYDPDVIKQILMNSNFNNRPDLFKFGNIPYSVLTSNDKIWQKVRKIMHLSFKPASVTLNTPIFNKLNNLMCEELQNHVNSDEFDIAPLLMKYIIAQLVETQFGEKGFLPTPKDIDILPVFSQTMVTRGFSPLYHLDMIYKFTNLNKLDREWHKHTEKLWIPMIEKTKKAMESDKENFNGSRRNLLYDFLKSDFPIEAAIDNAKMMIPAGLEGSFATVGHFLLMLAMHPEVDQKLHDEIKEFCKDGVEIDHNVVKEMTYLDMVFKEVLRLFPAAPGTIRTTIADTYVEGIGTIPKGTFIFVSFLTLHKDPELWGPNAGKFDPDNFLPERIAERHPHCYIPFSAGPRYCIGMNYANLSIRLMIVKLLSMYRFTTSLKYEDLSLMFQFTIRLNGNYLVKVHKR